MSTVRTSYSIFLFATLLSLPLATSLVYDAVSAENNASITTTIGVNMSCSVSTAGRTHEATLIPGGFSGQIGETTQFNVQCNDGNGYVMYAVGNTNNEEGTTDLVGEGSAANEKIITGIERSGDISNWSFKVHNASADLTIQEGFDDYAKIPSVRTAIVKKEPGAIALDGSDGGTFDVSYGIYVSGTQLAGTYTGKVKYILLHPFNHEPFPTTMQEFDGCCDALRDGTEIKLEDTRDGNSYTVRKLKDGRCWMVDNLRLGGNVMTLTPVDTDLNDGVESFTLPASSTTGFLEADDINVYIDTSRSRYGGYYTWLAATAGSGTTAGDGADASSSICPRGWKLPDGTEDGEFNNLAAAYKNSFKDALDPNKVNFVLAGYYFNGALHSESYQGYYWSSTQYNDTRAMSLYFNDAAAHLGNNNDKFHGNSVRCIAR